MDVNRIQFAFHAPLGAIVLRSIKVGKGKETTFLHGSIKASRLWDRVYKQTIQMKVTAIPTLRISIGCKFRFQVNTITLIVGFFFYQGLRELLFALSFRNTNFIAPDVLLLLSTTLSDPLLTSCFTFKSGYSRQQ